MLLSPFMSLLLLTEREQCLLFKITASEMMGVSCQSNKMGDSTKIKIKNEKPR